MPILNHASILMKVMKSPKAQQAAYEKLQAKVLMSQTKLIEEFDSNPVTREILAGPDIASSEILPFGYGNLFSFLGFDRNKPNPVEPVRKLLERIHLLRRPTVTSVSWNFTLRIPSQDDIDKASPMEWESGRSWIHAVTYGMGTFSHYMFNLKEGRFKNPKRNSSGVAVQIEPNLHATSSYLSGRGYLIGMMGRFKRSISR